MKATLSFSTLLILCLLGNSQQMQVKQANFTSFHADIKTGNRLLATKSSAEAKQNPEYGILPYNAQCRECMELIDARTANSRLFIDPKNEGHTYSQQSYFPLHYKKTRDDIWRTIDPRLRPDVNNSGVYVANNQPVPTKLDLNKKTTTLNTGELQFEFNKSLTLYFFDENTAYSRTEPGNYSHYTVGEEGLLVKNMWDGIDMEQRFRAGEIETNYVINAPLQLPIDKGWMVVEDHFTLPEGFTLNESPKGEHLKDGGFKGDYIVKNAKGEEVIIYKMPVYVDAVALGMHGHYKVVKNGTDYTLQMFVPVEWLNKKENTYPLLIDPPVIGVTKNGDFQTSTTQHFNGFGFTSKNLGSCDYHINAYLPGKSKITNVYVDLEYKLTYDNTCAGDIIPPYTSYYCTFNQVGLEVVCDACHTTTGNFGCSHAGPPYKGTCTTDGNLVPGAHSIFVNSIDSNYLACIKTQCEDYSVGFTLMNRDSICGDSCGYLCATGQMWQMTLEGETIPFGAITPDTARICAGDPVTFTANVNRTTLPAQYNWYWDNDSLKTNSKSITIQPDGGVVSCFFQDSACHNIGLGLLEAYVILPEAPNVSYLGGDTLKAESSSNIQWYFNDSLIIGATAQTFVATRKGNYSVRITDEFGCTSEMSRHLYVYFTGITEPGKNALVTIYPNPAKNELMIRTSNFQPQLMVLYDMNGRKITEQKFAPQIDISALAAGVYFIEIKGGDTKVKKKFVKANE